MNVQRAAVQALMKTLKGIAGESVTYACNACEFVDDFNALADGIQVL